MITNPFTGQVIVLNISQELHEKGMKMASAHMGRRVKQFKTMKDGSAKQRLRKDLNKGAAFLSEKHRTFKPS